ncbi:MAG: acetate uptake transporter [Propionibacteriaceae bacterium]|jgi:succinate-acetate transporter protein|nr:acetate uptake transporter [Propionibacteriaceae bacterium]
MTTADTSTRHLDVADPGPLGLAAFALTTFVLSVFNAGLVGASAQPVVFGLALFYGGVVQIAAGVMEFFKRNVFGALAFCSYGAFWLAFWYLSTHPEFFPAGDPLKATGVGVFLLAWTIFTAYMLVAASQISVGLAFTFTLLLITFIGLTIGDLAGLPLATRTAGWVGLATALSAWYCSCAGVLNATAGRTVLPVGARRRPA